MCKLCRKVKQSTFYSCGHEKVRTAEVPCILFWHKERKEVVFRNRYKHRILCKKCRVSKDKMQENIKKNVDSDKVKKGGNAGAAAGGIFAATQDNDGANAGETAAQQGNDNDANTGEAAAQQGNDNDANTGEAAAQQGNDNDANAAGAAAEGQRNGQVPNTDRAGGQPDAGPAQGDVRANANGASTT